MKKIIISLFIIIIALLGAKFALADGKTDSNPTVPEEIQKIAGTIPLNPFYPFDRLGEEIKKIILLPFSGSRYKYLQKLKEERQAELAVVEATKKGDTVPAATTLKELVVGIQADMEDLRRRDVIRVGRGLPSQLDLQGNPMPPEAYLSPAELAAVHAYNYIINQKLFELNGQKTTLRTDIEKARAAGETAKVQELLAQLKTVKDEYTRISTENNRYIGAVTKERERIEDLLTGPEMAYKVKAEIEAAQDRLYAEAERSGVTINKLTMAPLDDLIKQAERMLELQSYEQAAGMSEKLDSVLKTMEAKINAAITAKEKLEMTLEEKAELKKAESAAKPPLRPLGQPTPTASRELTFVPLTNFTARVGERFEYSFCQPAVARTSDLCTGSATNPQFGIPPYSFKYDTMGGFAPFGLTLNKNGLLAGTPTTEGTYPFKVCAVDQGGFSVCPTITINVEGKPCDTLKYGDCRGACIWDGNMCLNRCYTGPFSEQQSCDDACTASIQECYKTCEPLKCGTAY